jgi:hypothetical protein
MNLSSWKLASAAAALSLAATLGGTATTANAQLDSPEPQKRAATPRTDALQRRDPAAPQAVFGKIVDSDPNGLTIEAEGTKTIYQLWTGTEIVVDGKPGRITDIPAGSELSVFPDPNNPRRARRVVFVTSPAPAPTRPRTLPDDEPKVARDHVPSPVEIGWELATTTEGVRVERIQENSPAAEAHLEEGDVIRKVAGENVLTPTRVFDILNKLRPGSKVELTVWRAGEELSYVLTLPDEHKRVLDDPRTEPVAPRAHIDARSDLTQILQAIYQQEQVNAQLLQALLAETRAVRTRMGIADDDIRVVPGIPAAIGVVPGVGVTPGVGTTPDSNQPQTPTTPPDDRRPPRNREIVPRQPPLPPPTGPFEPLEKGGPGKNTAPRQGAREGAAPR